MLRRPYLQVQSSRFRVAGMDEASRPVDILVGYLTKIFLDPVMPEMPPELADVRGLPALRDQLEQLRNLLDAFSRGDFSPSIHMRGAIAGRLKNLQAGLLHLSWQCQQVAEGDFSQRVEFLGEFAASFNSMVEQLDSALSALRQKEEELTRLTLALQHEVSQKAEAFEALSKSEARFRYMAEHDPLTGVCNRRSFYDLAVMELEQARREFLPCMLLIFDIDHFKRFNDTYGHLDGDAALRHVTNTIKHGLRDQDILGRYGGEEFVLLLPGVDKSMGESVAERLRHAVATSPVMTKTAGPATVTISIGLVFVPPEGEGEVKVTYLEKLLGHADEALYQAKALGRNRLMVSPYPDSECGSP